MIKNNKGIAWRLIDNQAVIVDLKGNTTHIFNAVATRIWELANGKNRVSDIVEKIYQEYEVNQGKVEKDCLKCIHQMRKNALVILSSNPVDEG